VGPRAGYDIFEIMKICRLYRKASKYISVILLLLLKINLILLNYGIKIINKQNKYIYIFFFVIVET
jgi:hypothetical protein